MWVMQPPFYWEILSIINQRFLKAVSNWVVWCIRDHMTHFHMNPYQNLLFIVLDPLPGWCDFMAPGSQLKRAAGAMLFCCLETSLCGKKKKSFFTPTFSIQGVEMTNSLFYSNKMKPEMCSQSCCCPCCASSISDEADVSGNECGGFHSHAYIAV